MGERQPEVAGDLKSGAEEDLAPPVEVLVVCGPAGVGKTTVANEVSEQLKLAQIEHAVIDTDALDQVHPWPLPGLPPEELSRRNFAAVWGNFAQIGHRRLILTGVFVDLEVELAWITSVVPTRKVTVVRLRADASTLESRVHRGEIGSAVADQLRRTMAQVEAIVDPPGTIMVDTSSASVTDAAAEILGLVGWRPEPAK
jgi:broad-specificity NMP kinase